MFLCLDNLFTLLDGGFETELHLNDHSYDREPLPISLPHNPSLSPAIPPKT